MTATKQLIIAFDHPHRIGTICCPPCRQCGEEEGRLGDFYLTEGDPIPSQPMLILGLADYSDYVNQCKESKTPLPILPRGSGWFYYVSVD